jgi:hypothetical protein
LFSYRSPIVEPQSTTGLPIYVREGFKEPFEDSVTGAKKAGTGKTLNCKVLRFSPNGDFRFDRE